MTYCLKGDKYNNYPCGRQGDLLNLRIHLFAEGGNAFLVRLDERLELDSDVVNGFLQIDILLFLKDGQDVACMLVTCLLLLVGVDVLTNNFSLRSMGHTQLEATYVCNDNQIHRFLQDGVQDRVVEYVVREVNPQAPPEHPAHGENPDGFASDGIIGFFVKHDVFLAELCFGYHTLG